eukprot:Skav206651  [mRNA]  locus=scaffold1933:102779:103505:+ [translate_table: standard]
MGDLLESDEKWAKWLKSKSDLIQIESDAIDERAPPSEHLLAQFGQRTNERNEREAVDSQFLLTVEEPVLLTSRMVKSWLDVEGSYTPLLHFVKKASEIFHGTAARNDTATFTLSIALNLNRGGTSLVAAVGSLDFARAYKRLAQ